MDILHEIRAICARPAFREEIVDLLELLCAIDTSPGPDLARLRENEQCVFDVIHSALENLRLPGAAIIQQEISSAIQNHPAFSRPYYATGSVQEIYRARSNLLYLLDREPSATGSGIALNAHIDTVAPFIPPVPAGDFMIGRGTADDKGNVAAIVGALQVLAELERRGVARLNNKLTAMFVIDEETGGNGSLALAMDRELKARYDSILVLECTGKRLYPANRGAVFIKCEGRLADADVFGQATPSLLEAFALAILALLDEGQAIRRESDHPLFPHRPVQTCTGILGPFGVHPSAICGEVGFEVVFYDADNPGEHGNVTPALQRTQCGASVLSGLTSQGPQQQNFSEASPPRGRDPSLEVRRDALHPADPLRVTSHSTQGAEPLAAEVLCAIIDRGIARYVARHGDKTQVIDPATGARKVARHYDLAWQDADRCVITIHGATGHMGSLLQNDAAIAKWAYVMRELIDARRAGELAFAVAWPDADPCGPSHLVFEGAQGFLPTHTLEEVKARTRNAFLTAIQRYLTAEGLPPESLVCEVSFDKLHNNAYAGDPDSASMLRARRTAVDVGLAQTDQPMRGWEVSCDARLFAGEYPGLPVLTFGAGLLEHAHSDRERVSVADLIESIIFIALFVLRETGTMP
jgi:acetylornithine deacetylase/succinyl-diaminopimelate desuccinylase-like protein